MRRVPVPVRLLAVFVAVLVFSAAPLRGGAQTGTPSATSQGFVGA